MKYILLISHATLAKGVYEAAQMIYGGLSHVDYICLEQGMGIEDFKKKLGEKIDAICTFEEIIVLADLMGGSPYNTSVSLLVEKELSDKVKIISGLNLPLLLITLFEQEKFEDEPLEKIIQTARDGINLFKIEADDEEEL